VKQYPWQIQAEGT